MCIASDCILHQRNWALHTQTWRFCLALQQNRFQVSRSRSSFFPPWMKEYKELFPLLQPIMLLRSWLRKSRSPVDRSFHLSAFKHCAYDWVKESAASALLQRSPLALRLYPSSTTQPIHHYPIQLHLNPRSTFNMMLWTLLSMAFLALQTLAQR